MIPTINKRFLVLLSAVTLVLTGALFGVHAMQEQRIPEALKQQAERAAGLAGEDPKMADRAIHHYRQYLEFRPDDIDAEECLTVLLAERKREQTPDQLRRLHTELLRHYERILLVDGQRHEVRRKAIKSCTLLNRFTGVETHATFLLNEFPNEQALWLDLAYAQRGLNQEVKARENYEKAIKLDPKNRTAYYEYSEYLTNELKLKDEAKAVLDRLVIALPQEVESYIARGRFHVNTGNEVAAIADAKKAVEIDSQNADALILLGEQLQKRREGVVTAAETFREGMKLHPTDPRFVRNLAWLEVNRGNPGSAATTLEDGMARVSEKESFDLTVSLADLLLEMKDLDRAKDLIHKLERRSETNPARKQVAEQQATYMKARLAMSERRWSDALGGFMQLRRSSVNNVSLENQVNLLAALCHQRKGEFDEEEQSLKLVLGRDPNHAAARRALGDAYLNSGRFDEAITEYEQAARNRFATSECRAKYLRMKATRLRTTGAGKKEWGELDALLAQFEPTFGTASSEFAILRAEMLSLRGSYDRAFAVLRTEAGRRPSDPLVWARTASAAADLAGVSAGLSILDEAQAICGDRTELRQTRATLYARDPSRLRPLNPLTTQIDTWPETEQVKLLYGLINAFEQIGDEAGVIRTYRRLAGRYPADIAVWEGLFDRATRTGDQKTAAESRQMIAKQSTERLRSEALLTAWQTANAKDTGRAGAAIEELTRQFGSQPDRAEACVALARLRAMMGDQPAAASQFARAVRLEPVRFGPTLEYLTYLTATGQDESLGRLVGRLTQDHRWRGDALRRAVRQTVARVDQSAAERLLDLVRPAVENEPDGLGWLGDCYQAVGLTSEAKQCIEKAVSSPLATSDDWLRMAIRTGEMADAKAAERTLAEAKKRIQSPQLYYVVTALFADSPVAPKGWEPELASPADRKLFIQAKLSVKLSRYLKDEAISVLEEYLSDKRTPTADALWARRNLAMMLAARGIGTDRTRSKELLTGSDVSAGETADEKRSTAAVLAGLSKQLEGEDRDQVLHRAIRVLSEVVNETKNKRDRFLLSQLYRSAANRSSGDTAKEDRTKGRVLLQDLIREDPRNVEYYIAALDEATEPADQEFAEKCAGFLIGNHAGDFRVVQAVARYECRSNRPEKALSHVMNYTKMANSSPGDLQERTGRAAELLDELVRKHNIRGTDVGRKMTGVAVDLYENLFSIRPDVMVAMAGLLSNDGRADEAFAKIEKHTKVLPPRVKVLSGLAVLRACAATEGQFVKVREWIDATKTEEPGSIDVYMNEGEYCALRRDLAGAERAYQAVLELDDQHVVALNNLAWMLSVQPDATDRALELIERAVRLIGLTSDLLETRARVLITKQKYDAAERDLTIAMKQEPTALRTFQVALLNWKRSNHEAARTSFRDAQNRGLREWQVHPADIDDYRSMVKAVIETK